MLVLPENDGISYENIYLKVTTTRGQTIENNNDYYKRPNNWKQQRRRPKNKQDATKNDRSSEYLTPRKSSLKKSSTRKVTSPKLAGKTVQQQRAGSNLSYCPVTMKKGQNCIRLSSPAVELWYGIYWHTLLLSHQRYMSLRRA
jgi:hypothetical protein